MRNRDIIETSKQSGMVWEVSPTGFVGPQISQASKSTARSAEDRRRRIIPLAARAVRSHVRRIVQLVSEGRESFKKFADYGHFARLVPAESLKLARRVSAYLPRELSCTRYVMFWDKLKNLYTHTHTHTHKHFFLLTTFLKVYLR